MEDINMTNFYKYQLKELEQKVENAECKEEWEAAAQKLRIYYDAMIKAGFTEEQAWWFVTAAVRQAWGIS